MESLLEIIPEEIAKGQIVRLGDFGDFSINSTGIEKEEDVSLINIIGNSLNFRVQKALETISYKKHNL